MPSNGHRLRFIADVLGGNGGVDGAAGEGNAEGQVGLGEPVAAEIAGVDDAGLSLSVGGRLGVQRFSLAFENKSVDGVNFGAVFVAFEVGGQGQSLAMPFGGEGLAIRRKLAADAVGVRHEKGPAAGEAEIADAVVTAALELIG